jgi:hypothetical protein
MDNTVTSEQQLRTLVNKQLISELVASYSRGVDRQDFSLLRTLFTEDGFDDHGDLYRGNAAGYIDCLEQAMQGCDITSHAVHNHLIALTDENNAEGEVYVSAYHRIRDDKEGLTDYIGGFRYLDQYRLEGGTWRFARRQLIIDWCKTAPAFWNINEPWLPGTPIGATNSDDHSYALTHPLFARH